MHSSCRPLLATLLFAACRTSETAPEGATASQENRLTLEQTMGRGGPDFTGKLPGYSWAWDGRHLAFQEGERTVWIDPATGAESEPQAKAEASDEKGAIEAVAKALKAAGIPEERLKTLAKNIGKEASNGGRLVALEGERWWVRDGLARLLADEERGPLELAELSPDGGHLAFIQENNLVLVSTTSAARRELTQDGSVDIFNGKLDWVYQEEVYGRGDFKAFWWSPDSRHVAFLRLDEHAVHDFTVIDHIEEGHFRVKPELTRYPKVGDPNPTVSLGVADATTPSETRWIDLSAYAGQEPIVVRVDWSPGGELLYMVQNRIQNWLELCAVDPLDPKPRVLLRETSQGWVNRADAPRWLADGGFLLLSERTGQRHVYRYRADGTLDGAVTEGAWSVGRIEHLDEASGRLWFTSTRDGAVNSNLYRIALDGTGLARLTPGPGRHGPQWNEARTHFLDSVSTLSDPPRMLLCDAEGRVVRELGEADAPDRERYATGRWELLSVPARDGFELDAALLVPVDFDPKRRYPVWLPTYSGPDAPSVRNGWNGSSWYQFLAQNGVMVFQVNVRSASGKGQAVIESCYEQLGVQELRDLEDAIDWLGANRSADTARVGITGASYGGFMTAYALTHSKHFALGIAASGVYDWRMYDTIYTERYMSTPALNAEGYAKTSVVEAAADLEGHLVITHGVMDDNVHLQNALQLVYALQKAGKDFELMLYPQNRHGIRDAELRAFDRRLTWRKIREHLLAEKGPHSSAGAPSQD